MVYDQASELRKRLYQTPTEKHQTKIITITSGKGGVGKSNFTLNFALALLELGQKVAVLDADIGLANIDVLMGITPKYTLQDMLSENLEIWDIIENGPNGLQFLAGGSNLQYVFEKTTNFEYLFEQFLLLNGYIETLLVDTGAGISKESLRFMLSSDEVYIVTTPEPTSITDAYAMIKMIYSKNKHVKISLIINRATSEKEGLNTANRIKLVSKQFLNLEIDLLGIIFDDEHVSKAVKKQQPFYLIYPNSKASKNIQTLVSSYTKTTVKSNASGVKSFLEKMSYWFNR